MSMNFLANGLDLASGDEVISTDQEHGGCISPWRLKAKRYGIVVKELKLDDGTKGGVEGVVKLFADAMTPKTKAVMFSHVVSGLGTRMPARELCAMIRDRGALALVDGAQALGKCRWTSKSSAATRTSPVRTSG
jgi:selenocysteine lyase/cysteine desulfurase